MGWADMLVQLGVQYNSEDGIKIAELIMKFIQNVSWDESERLAKEKATFPLLEESYFNSTHNPFGKIRPVRNVAVTTIAPTGTISMIADCSSGIEPYFALEYTKNVVEKEGLKYTNKYYDAARQNLKSQISNLKTTTQNSKPTETETALKQIFRTAHEITPDWHVKMQAAFQKYTDNAVSKTINFPNSATIKDVEHAYLLAWKLGCKGITVYRDGSRSGQILSSQEPRVKSHDNHGSSRTAHRTGAKRLMQSQMKITPLSQRAYKYERRQIVEASVDGHCPECGSLMEESEGCSLCRNCGYSRCSI
jgi:ribonucleoside-diphosphate reductase alpha chain